MEYIIIEDKPIYYTDLVGRPELWPKMVKEFERLQAIETKLPITADGVRVVPCREKVFHPTSPDGQLVLRIFGQWQAMFRGKKKYTPISECYSTLKLAKAAKEKE